MEMEEMPGILSVGELQALTVQMGTPPLQRAEMIHTSRYLYNICNFSKCQLEYIKNTKVFFCTSRKVRRGTERREWEREMKEGEGDEGRREGWRRVGMEEGGEHGGGREGWRREGERGGGGWGWRRERDGGGRGG